jgi:membrane fusion protein (multidrug efflux system)
VRLNIEAMKAGYQAALQNTSAKEQRVNADQAAYDRYASLVERHAVTPEKTDDARYKLAADQQAVSASESQAEAQLAMLDGKPNIAAEATPAFRQAQARVAGADREINHSVVRAP